MAARPRPLPPSPPPSNTPRPLLDPLRRPPSQWESSKPPTLRERWRTSDGGRAMADERWRTVSWRMNKNLCLRRPVSEPGPLRMRDCRADHWTTETSCAWRRDMAPGSYVSQVQIISLQSIPVSQIFIGAQVTEHYRSAI
ncbi:hypothetical protein J6590_088703 [Homalodisca vitripennis]|nr:hypothetical protein J6590_088703 [Homalodisca vitripennis]